MADAAGREHHGARRTAKRHSGLRVPLKLELAFKNIESLGIAVHVQRHAPARLDDHLEEAEAAIILRFLDLPGPIGAGHIVALALARADSCKLVHVMLHSD